MLYTKCEAGLPITKTQSTKGRNCPSSQIIPLSLSLFIVIILILSHLTKPTKNSSKASRRYQSKRNHQTNPHKESSIHITIWAAYIYTTKGYMLYPNIESQSPNLPYKRKKEEKKRKDVDDNPSIHAVFVLLLFPRLRYNQRNMVWHLFRA